MGAELSDDSAFAGLDEGEKFGQSGIGRELGSDGLTSLFDVEVAPTEEAIGFTEGTDFLGGEAPAFESDLIDAPDFGRVAISDHEGGDVLNDLGTTTENGVLTDAAKLVDAAEAADDRIVLDDDMSSQGAIVGKNDMVPDRAVMGHVGVGEEIVVISDDGLAPGARAAVDGAKFAEAVVGADFEVGRLGFVFKILRSLSDRTEREEMVAVSNPGGAGHADVTGEDAMGADGDIGSNDAEGPNFRIFSDLGRGVDDGGGMDH